MRGELVRKPWMVRGRFTGLTAPQKKLNRTHEGTAYGLKSQPLKALKNKGLWYIINLNEPFGTVRYLFVLKQKGICR